MSLVEGVLFGEEYPVVELPTPKELDVAPAPDWLSGDQKEIWDVFEKCKIVALQKNHDYGGSVFEAPILTPDMPIDSAIMVRISDKINRLIHLLGGGTQCVKDEKIEDSLLDLSTYCKLAYIARKRMQR